MPHGAPRMSGKVVIQVENLCKHYRLGTIGGATLREDLGRWWARARGKPDPWARVDEVARTNDGGEGFWALRDVSFEVREGEVLGVIGRNGAGKSTLLKILSRITSPTSGRALIRGRVGSLLEVGTGFHPELTGRENIYLNGAILGMTRAEITRKLDEIIEFAEMAKFIDTPVKRYSSGMTVRLAFAVAAHLEPEILIVDEVLAVGDAEFQNKCIRKLGDTATSGRTVMFVSHNMSAVRRLCTSAIMLARGALAQSGDTATVCDTYLGQESDASSYPSRTFGVAGRTDLGRLLEVRIRPLRDNEASLTIESGFLIQCIYQSHIDSDRVHVSLNIYTNEGVHVLNTFPESTQAGLAAEVGRGPVLFECRFPPRLLNAGRYRLEVYVVRRQSEPLIHEEAALYFSVADKESGIAWHGTWKGVVRPRLPWSYRPND